MYIINWKTPHPTCCAAGEPANTQTENKAEDTPEKDEQKKAKKEPCTNLNAEAQKMANAIVAKKLKGMPGKEELAEFRQWQERRKTPQYKENEEMRRLRREAETAKQKLAILERKDKAMRVGVAPAFCEFVAFEAGKLVSQEISFEAALAAYLKINPQFKGALVPQCTYPTHSGNHTITAVGRLYSNSRLHRRR